MKLWSIAGSIALAAAAGAAVVGHVGYRRNRRVSEQAYAGLLRAPRLVERRFDPRDVEGLPESARRYFAHAIAPGTPLYSGAELHMDGTFLLGDARKHQTYRMSAREALRGDGFVWLPELRSGMLTIDGSDALVSGKAWTRFWVAGLVRVANERTSEDLVRSAQFRAAIEAALWVPTTLLPENGVRWSEVGPDTARVVIGSVAGGPIALTLKLGPEGAVREVFGHRWSNANADRRFRLQPFGGTTSRDRTFHGLTVPTQVAVGNLFGTPDYLPFFQATITQATYF
jgi:hypothetical protein